MVKRIEIRAVFRPLSVWDVERSIIIHCDEKSDMTGVFALARNIEEGKYMPYGNKYRVKAVRVVVTETTK